MTLIEKYAQKMLDEKLDFLPIEDAHKLYEQGIIVPSREHYCISIENFTEFNGVGDETEFYIKEILETYSSLERAQGKLIEIGDSYDLFEEFTYALFPAPTYIDLIR